MSDRTFNSFVLQAFDMFCFCFALPAAQAFRFWNGRITTMMPDDATTGGDRDPWDVQPTPSGSMCAVKFLVCHY